MKNAEFIKELSNPLNDEKKIEEILEAYKENGNLYEEILNTDCNKRYVKSYRRSDANKLEKYIFKIWKKNILNLNSELASDKRDLRKLKRLLRRTRPRTARQIKKFFRNFDTNKRVKLKYRNLTEIMDKLGYKKEYKSSIQNIESNKINIKNNSNNIKHRLYINLDSKVQYPFAYNFIKKCNEKGLEYNLQFDRKAINKDGLIIFSDDEHLNEYIKIINDIIENNKRIKKGVNETPLLTSKVNNYIGYAEQPTINNKSNNIDIYMNSRTELLKKDLDQISTKLLIDGLKKNSIYLGDEKIAYKDFMLKILFDNKMDDLRNKYSKRKILNRKSKKIESELFKENLKNMISKNLDKFISVKFDKDKINYKQLESIKLNNSISISLTKEDIEKAIRSQTYIMCKKNKYFKDKVIEKIKNDSVKYNISSNNLSLSNSTDKILNGNFNNNDEYKSNEKKKDLEKEKTKAVILNNTENEKEKKSETKATKPTIEKENKPETKATKPTIEKENVSKGKEEKQNTSQSIPENKQQEENIKENNIQIDENQEDTIDEFIPGTKIKRPRYRKTNETDIEYLKFLKNYYEKYFKEQIKNSNKTNEIEKETYSYKPMTKEEIDKARENIEYYKYEKIYADRNEKLKAQKQEKINEENNNICYKKEEKPIEFSCPEDLINLLKEYGNIVNNGTINITNNYYGNNEKGLSNSTQINENKILRR